MVPPLVFALSFLIVSVGEVDIGDLVDGVYLRSIDGSVDVLMNPTLGMFNWRMEDWKHVNSKKVLILIGDVIGSHFAVSDTMASHFESSSVDLIKVSKILKDGALMIVTESEIDTDLFRRIGWSGTNVLVFDDLKDFLNALDRGDSNGDGVIDLVELGRFTKASFVPENFGVFFTLEKIASTAFEKVYKLYREGKISAKIALTIARAILENDENALLFGAGKLNLAEALSKIEGR